MTMGRKVAKVYLSPPLSKMLDETSKLIGLSDSETLRLALIGLAEKHGLLNLR
jgi:hypothetical protein